jgi:hypothetical protein
LGRYSIPYDEIIMREVGDFTPDEELKKLWLLRLYPDFQKKVLCVFNDREKW